MKEELIWNFEISNEKDVNDFIGYLDSENIYTGSVLNNLEKQYDAFLQLSSVIDGRLDNEHSDSLSVESLVKKNRGDSDALTTIKSYVHCECRFIKRVREYELNKLAHTSCARDILVESRNIIEFEENLKIVKRLMQGDRMPEAYLTSLIYRNLSIITKIYQTIISGP